MLSSNENEQSTTTCNGVDEVHIHIEQGAREFTAYDPIYKKIQQQQQQKGEADLSCWKSEEWLFLGQIVTRGDSQIKFKTTTTTREVISVKYMKRRSYRPMRMSSSFKAPKIRTDKTIKEQNSQRRTASIS